MAEPDRSRSVCFTLNNPTDDELVAIRTRFDQENPPPGCIRFVAQLERGENGTLHLQGYVGFDNAKSYNTIKRLLGRRCHLEPSRGDPKSNLTYCTKAETRVSDDDRWPEPYHFGEFLGFGGRRAAGAPGGALRRADVITFLASHPAAGEAEVIEEGGLQVLALTPNIIPQVRSLLAVDERRFGVSCDLYVGAAGTGKSRLADCLFPTAYRKPTGTWWDGYASERVCILDDYDGDFMPIGNLLQVLDRYPLRSQVKGGFVKIVATHFVITSNLHPRDWYRDLPPARLLALYRRFTHVLEFLEGGVILKHHPPTYFSTWGPGELFYVPPEIYTPPWAQPVPPSPLIEDFPVVQSPL